MNDKVGQLTERDQAFMTAFLNHFFDRTLSGAISKETFTGVLVQVISAVDIGNIGEARCHFEEGRNEKDLRLLLDGSIHSGGLSHERQQSSGTDLRF